MEENKKEEKKEKVEVKETTKNETKETKTKKETKKDTKKDTKKENNAKTEELKKEATDTVNQVKDTIKNFDIKKDSIETKGFVVEMFKNPLGKIKEIVDKDTSKYFTYGIIILAIWVVARLINRSFSFSHIWGLSRVGSAILSILISGITPIVSVLVMSLIVFVMNTKNKKQLTTVITAIISASIPSVIASVVSILTIFGTKVSTITAPFASFCEVISTVLMYFTIKAIFGVEKNSEFIKKFVLIQGIFYIVYIVLSFFEIYI